MTVDVSTPATPNRGARTGLASSIQDVQVAGNTVFVSANRNADILGASGTVDVLDVTEVGRPVWVASSTSFSTAGDLEISGSTAVVASRSSVIGTVKIFDVASGRPVLKGTYEPAGVPAGIAVSGEIAYISVSSLFGSQLDVVQISDLARPTRIGKLSIGYPQSVQIVGTTAYVACQWDGMRIIDVSTPANPKLLGTYDSPGKAMDVKVVGTLAYLADGDNGLQIIDVANSARPSRIGTADSPGFAGGLAVTGNLAFVADGSAGLQVFDLTNPRLPERIGSFNTLGIASAVQVVGNRIYVADGEWGLRILEIRGTSINNQDRTIKGTAARGALTTPVTLTRFDSESVIDSKLDAWLVIHGRNSASTSPNIVELASVLKEISGGFQILTLDWSKAAAPLLLDDFQGEDWIQPVALWAAEALKNAGFTGAKLNLAGHSWGALLADELAERIAGGVDSIIAIDPAQDVPFSPLTPGGIYDPDKVGEIDFAAHSSFSWAFRSDRTGLDSGSQVTPKAADEAFVVKNSDHSLVVTLVANLIRDGRVGANQLFQLTRLFGGRNGPWIRDNFNADGIEHVGGGYEAVIISDKTGAKAESIVFLALPQISAHLNAKTLTLTLPSGVVVLEEADDIVGPWRALPIGVAQTSYDVPITAGRKFYRIKR